MSGNVVEKTPVRMNKKCVATYQVYGDRNKKREAP
jgi:hypothetical protein